MKVIGQTFLVQTGNPSLSNGLYQDSSGKVGIGSNNPDYKLTVADTSSYVIQNLKSSTTEFCGIYFGDTDGAARGTIVYENAADAMTFRTNGSGEDMRIDSSGRLLVGTPSTSLSNKFALQGDTSGASNGGYMRLQTANSVVSGTSLGSIGFGDTANNGALIEAKGDVSWSPFSKGSRLEFSTTSDSASSPTERVRITSNGVFKQSTSGSYSDATGIYNEFNVNNSNSYVVITRCTSSSPASEYIQDFRFSAAAPNNTSARFWSCTDNSAERGYLASNGGLYNYSANNSNLSDRNAKKDISLAAGTWDCLKEWEIVNFRYKDQPDDAGLNLGDTFTTIQKVEGCLAKHNYNERYEII